MLTYQPVERDTSQPLELQQPHDLAELQKAIADAPNMCWLEAVLNHRTGQTFTGWLVDAPVGLYTVPLGDGSEATITNLDHLFSAR